MNGAQIVTDGEHTGGLHAGKYDFFIFIHNDVLFILGFPNIIHQGRKCVKDGAKKEKAVQKHGFPIIKIRTGR